MAARNRAASSAFAVGGVAGAAFADLDDVEPAKAELAAVLGEPLAIALGELALRALLQPADREDDETHVALQRA